MPRFVRRLKPGRVEKLFMQGRQDEALSEEYWRVHARKLARLGGWSRAYHTYNSVRSDHGWPDETFSRDEPSPRVVFIEFKCDGNHLTVEQYDQLRLLRAAGLEAYALWFPSQQADLMNVLLKNKSLEDRA